MEASLGRGLDSSSGSVAEEDEDEEVFFLFFFFFVPVAEGWEVEAVDGGAEEEGAGDGGFCGSEGAGLVAAGLTFSASEEFSVGETETEVGWLMLCFWTGLTGEMGVVGCLETGTGTGFSTLVTIWIIVCCRLNSEGESSGRGSRQECYLSR